MTAIGLLITTLMLLSFMGLTLAADGIPPLPDSFYGDLTVNGDPAPVGVTLVAKIKGVERGRYTTQQVGVYGSSDVAEPELWWLVKGTEDDKGKEIHFWIADYKGDLVLASGDPTHTFESGADPRKVDLTFTGVELKAPALVTTESATNITASSATLNASIDYGDYVGVDIAFFYREVGESWADTGLDTVTATSYSKGITGLKEETSYEFYAYIEFDGLDDTGATKSFTTTAVAPPEKATLTVNTTPVKGEVFVDGSSWGTAPQTMKLDAGTYTVSFGNVSGYITPSDQTVTLAAGETKTVTGTYVVIPPEKATLTVDTTPVKGEVFVDGVSWGTAPQTRSLDAGTYTVSFGDVPDYETPASETVTLTAGETKTVKGTYTEIPTPAEFELSNLVISPTEVEVGETVTISVDVANVGGTAGTCPVTLKINGIAVDTKNITLAAGATGTVTFKVTEEVAGTYAVDVDGLTGEFTVTTPPLRVPLEVVATVLIVALLLVIFIGVRSRRT